MGRQRTIILPGTSTKRPVYKPYIGQIAATSTHVMLPMLMPLRPAPPVSQPTSVSVAKAASVFWDAQNETHAKELIGPQQWGRSAQEYIAELFDTDPQCATFLKSFKPAKPNVLEIGCGMGRILRGIAPRFGRVYGLDISDGMLRLGADYVKGTDVHLAKIVGCQFPLGDDSVDLVFSVITFQHIQDRATIQKYLVESRRVLRPGGLIRVQTHRGDPHPAGVFGGFHGHFYANVDAFAAEFMSAGFEVITRQVGVGHSEWLWVTARKP